MIWPRRIAATPQEIQSDKIGDLEREIRQLKAAQANQLQRGRAVNFAGVSGVTTNVDLGCSVTVDIPTTDSNVIYFFRGGIQPTTSTTQGSLYIREGSNDFILYSYTGVGLAYTDQFLDVQNAATINAIGGSVAHHAVPALFYRQGRPASVGTKTFSLRGERTAGAGTVAFTDLELWMAVV